MLIRDERPDDAPTITAITQSAFENHPHSNQTEGRIIDALRSADAMTVSLVADDDGEIVGHIAFSPVIIDDADGIWFALGPISVSPARQRRGVGSDLIRHGLERLKAKGAAGCVLIGEPAYYQRFGFTLDPALTYRDLPAGYLQYLSLDGSIPRGEVSFHPAFDVM